MSVHEYASEVVVECRTVIFCVKVRSKIVGVALSQTHSAILDLFSDEVVPCFNVAGLSREVGCEGDVDGWLVVHVDRRGVVLWEADGCEEVAVSE